MEIDSFPVEHLSWANADPFVLVGEVYLLKVTRAATSSFEASNSEQSSVENSAMYQCNSTGDIVVILDDSGDTLSLKNQFTQEIKEIRREDFELGYTEM